ncbi:MAG: rhamnulose-1-phosphate aldolase [Coriobacteriaceae bacterium]|jgi:rhamnulose-1-phosphate aldolase|nr:rhamnulose-1-phosphate aldolase [Coriobacteriaceae bacterium]
MQDTRATLTAEGECPIGQESDDCPGFDRFAFARFIANQECAQAFVGVVDDAWLQGWHESNGGNLSYRLREEERDAYHRYLEKPLGGSKWTDLDCSVPELAGEYFLVTAAGSHFRTVRRKSSATTGLVEIRGDGKAWRVIGGFEGQGVVGRSFGKPTSEFAAHVAVHAARKRISQGRSRAVYHAHPAQVIALTAVLPQDSRTVSRILWKSLTESILVIPEGVGVLPWMVPGSGGLAQATSALMEKHAAVLWPWHGLCCAADSLEGAFGLVHTIEKASSIYLRARAAHKQQEDELPHSISDAQLLEAAQAFGVALNKDFLA